MKDTFEDSVRKDFEEASRYYQDSRFEPLPAAESLILEEWISIINRKDERDAMDILSETFMLTAALSNGFSPSEYMDSISNSQIRQLRELQIEPDDIPISTDIHDTEGYIEFIIRLRRWLISDDRSPAFMDGLALDSEYAFWVGCFLKVSDLENARESFHIAMKGSLTKRMRIRALQNVAWICVHLSAFDDAVSSYDRIIELAELHDTKELAAECRGYIKALRDHGINEPETEFTFAPTAAEFVESRAVRQADEIRESFQLKGEAVTPFPVPSHLEKEFYEGRVVDIIHGRLSQQLGTDVGELPAEVVDELVDAERSLLKRTDPGRAIVDLYKAVEICLNCYVGTRFIPYAYEKLPKRKKTIKSLSISQWSYLFLSLDETEQRRPPLRVLELFKIPFRSFLKDSSSWHNRPTFLSLGPKLRRIQKMCNPYRHPGGTIASGFRSWTEQTRDLQEIHRLVIGQQDPNSIINQLIRLDISKKT